MFVCLIGEDWQTIMHNYARAKKDRLIPNLFFVIIMIIGHLFLMNLFLAILLKNFEQQVEDEEDPNQQRESLIDFKKIYTYVRDHRYTKELKNSIKKMFSISNDEIIDDLQSDPFPDNDDDQKDENIFGQQSGDTERLETEKLSSSLQEGEEPEKEESEKQEVIPEFQTHR